MILQIFLPAVFSQLIKKGVKRLISSILKIVQWVRSYVGLFSGRRKLRPILGKNVKVMQSTINFVKQKSSRKSDLPWIILYMMAVSVRCFDISDLMFRFLVCLRHSNRQCMTKNSYFFENAKNRNNHDCVLFKLK